MLPARELYAAVRAGFTVGSNPELLFERKGKCVARLHLADGVTVIVKLWSRPGARGWCRRLTRTGNLHREWWALVRLHARGIPVPAPLGRLHLPDHPRGFTDALICQDLGDCTRANLRLEEIVAREGSRDEFDESIIELTGAVLDAGVMDVDNHLNNIVFTSDGSLVRIDLELARRAWLVQTKVQLGQLLGALICSYLFAVQPRTELANPFSERLLDRLRPDAKSLRGAREWIEASLDSQSRNLGIDSRWEPIW